jgi:hypothetical protein
MCAGYPQAHTTVAEHREFGVPAGEDDSPMKCPTFRQYEISAGLLLILGLVCAFAGPASAQAGPACKEIPHYPKAIVERGNATVETTLDSREHVVAWYKQHLPGWRLRHRGDSQFETWLFLGPVPQGYRVRIDWQVDIHGLRILYRC